MGEALPGEQGAEQDQPDEIADERMPRHANLPGADGSSTENVSAVSDDEIVSIGSSSR